MRKLISTFAAVAAFAGLSACAFAQGQPLTWRYQMTSGVSTATYPGDVQVTGEIKGAITVAQSVPAPVEDGAVTGARNSPTTAFDIYGPVIPAGYYYFGVNRSVLSLNPGTTVQHGSAFDAYTINNVPQGVSPNQANAVGLFAQGISAVDNAATWGVNTACGDNAVNGAATLSGRKCIGWEADFEVNGASTIQGAALIIQGVGTPANANGFQISRASGATAQWTNGYITDDGAAAAALRIGTLQTTGASTPGQPTFWNYRDASNIVRGVQLQANNAALNITDNANPDGAFVQTGNTNVTWGVTGASSVINLNLNSKGATGRIITNSPITLFNYTVASLPTCAAGNRGATAYVTDATAPAWNTALAGGGAVVVPAFCNGAAWVAY